MHEHMPQPQRQQQQQRKGITITGHYYNVRWKAAAVTR